MIIIHFFDAKYARNFLQDLSWREVDKLVRKREEKELQGFFFFI